jgi:hypothetical protein
MSQGFGFVSPQNRLFLNVKHKFVIVKKKVAQELAHPVVTVNLVY